MTQDQKPAGRARLPCYIRGNDEDAGPDHRADDDHCGIEEAQAADETGLACDGLCGCR